MLSDNAFGDILVEDYNLRKFLKKKLYDAGVPKIEIESNRRLRFASTSTAPVPVSLSARAARRLKSCALECEALVNKGKTQKLTVLPLGVIEVKQPR